jgi:6-pyruvoyltetrahydropterin/6-carboxytetrahydropterin synthase
MYYVTKTYDHNLGLAAVFRQPEATSHCKDPHGYPLSFKLKFGAEKLDRNHWVLDFGGLKPVKAWLCDNFDHRTILAEDDPFRAEFEAFYGQCGFAPILFIPFVGCEGFATYVFQYVKTWLEQNHRVDVAERGLHLAEVEVREHGANSAIYSEAFNG